MQLFDFNLRTSESLVHFILLSLFTFLSVFTLGLALPWIIVWHQKWYFAHTTLDGKALQYTATGADFIKEFLTVIVLVVLTLGIYSFRGYARLQKWHWSRTSIAE